MMLACGVYIVEIRPCLKKQIRNIFISVLNTTLISDYIFDCPFYSVFSNLYI